jgi:hypothetical protein
MICPPLLVRGAILPTVVNLITGERMDPDFVRMTAVVEDRQ